MMTIADLDNWEAVHDLYDPEPYRKAFMLENLVGERCCIRDGGCYKLHFERTGDCTYLFECWATASYCGPAFVRKYKIPRKER